MQGMRYSVGRWKVDINRKGEIVISPKFDRALEFKNGKAQVAGE